MSAGTTARLGANTLAMMQLPYQQQLFADPKPHSHMGEQDQESYWDPQSKLQPNESLMLAGRVKECLIRTVIHQKHS